MQMAKIEPQKVLTLHLCLIVCLALGHVAATILFRDSALFSHPQIRAFFDLDGERGLGSYFSAIGLLACAGVAWFLSSAEYDRAARRFWGAVALLAAFLSVDESLGIHENFSALANLFTPATGVFRWNWWAGYVAVLAPVICLMVPGLLKLERATQLRLVAAGLVFVAGAVGFEILESARFDAMLAAHGIDDAANIDWAQLSPAINADLAYQRSQSVLVLCEEVLEMLGVAMALRTLLMRAADLRALFGVAVIADEHAVPRARGLDHGWRFPWRPKTRAH